MPASIQEVVAVPVPADGQVHVLLSAETFTVNPDTIFCGSAPVLDEQMAGLGILNVGLVGLEEDLKSIGQSDYLNGSPRLRVTGPKACEDATAIRHRGYALRNRAGRPFKLILAVWQGDATWVGAISRDLDPDNPDSWGKLPYRKGGPQILDAIVPSITELSDKFSQHLLDDAQS